ncbi:MotA/TolQ/ExbB proton channel family protein [Ruegeria sp.]|uniref:MotA/TolQ/ExbB proton channel family protein n=1 Tax=Ruegeria sp. TaxID=1879320 RepID=UPI0023186FC2|nr:MotA/TolQ/ExbB proton channel family protein [Ruegeria sp.]MDA7966447.1 MotA/TolQ/ExbB proton channel family protein [Ruegeria sp.]
MIKHWLILTALFIAPLAVNAQTTAPEVATDSPTLTEPSAPEGLSVPAVNPAPLPPNPLTGDPDVPALGNVSDETLPAEPAAPEGLWETTQTASDKAVEFLRDGGPSIWAIAALSVVTLALILWKIWRLALIGAWSRGKAGHAVTLFEAGDPDGALSTVKGRRGIRSIVVANAIRAIGQLPEDHAREETARVAKREIAQAGTGLRALELIATIAPLLGLLGTVLGMIAAFQALQQAGNRADPALLAGGIWEALLTTAAGMAVAIPASAALTWFEAVIDRIRRDVEDGAARLFVADRPRELKLAAE